MIRVLFGLVLVALAGTAAAAWVVLQRLEAPQTSGEAIPFEVARGASVADIARDLESAGLVRDARSFRWLARFEGADAGIRAGEYLLPPTLDARGVLERLEAGAVRTYAVSIPEGFTMVQIAERVEAAGLARADAFLEIARDPDAATAFGVEGPSLEGYLFPETYRLARGLGARAVVETMIAQFLSVWGELAPRAAERGLSMQEVVTLASIVEKETGAPHERPRIAAVFLNRIDRGMRLQTDPTVIYGIADFDGNLRRVHLEDASNPYNTYQIPGLPPGPIASPGAAALRAVLDPAESDELYFVSRNDGTHVFSRTYREHDANVDRYQRRRR